MLSAVLQVRNLTVTFSNYRGLDRRGVNNVSFDIGPGETVGLLGESGCGKTTLALALTRLLPQTTRAISGSVLFRGRDVLLANEYELQKIRGAEISIIFQEPGTALNPVMRVGDQIIEVLRAHRHWTHRRYREEAESLLRQVRLPDAHIYSAFPHQLSGGECQRVVIAQALACKPALLIADEPTSALDNTTQAQLLGLLKEMKDRLKLNLFFITHNPLLLAGIADRVLIMYAGRIVEEGTLAQVLRQPRHPYTRGLLRSIPPLSGKHAHAPRAPLPTIPGVPPELAHLGKGCPFEPRCPERLGICVTQDPEQVKIEDGVRVRCFNMVDERSHTICQPAALLKVRHLSKCYAQRKWFSRNKSPVKALDDISLTVHSSSTVALVGESGSGKSTLARCVARLTETDAGEIWFEDKNLLTSCSTDLRATRRQIQLIFQNSSAAMSPRFSAAEIVSEPLRIQERIGEHERRKQALAMLEQVGIPSEWADRSPLQFSGGQRQRLILARALVLKPALLILDEALSGLDLSIQAQIANLLLELQASFSLTYLYISHDLHLAGYLADEIVIMQRGKIVESGSVVEVFSNPSIHIPGPL
ncbi:MAG: dipeptide ABC transporter ATP-binding protein [Bryobacteraceae bacterium]